MSIKNLFTLSLLAPTLLAAPYKGKTRSKRQDVTYTCELSGTYRIEGGLTWGPGDTSTSSQGNTNGGMALSIIGSDGSNRGLSVGEGELNPIGMDGFTISKDDTSLENDISWDPDYNLGFKGCTCQYGDYTNSSGVVDGSVWSSPMYNENSETCACSFPCNAPSYDAGWCGLHISQKEREDDIVNYTVEVKDASGNNIGSVWNMDVKQGDRLWVPSNLPDDVWFANPIDDRDSVYVGYQDQQWETADASRCKVGAYDSGFRQMDCGFTCN